MESVFELSLKVVVWQ